MSAGFDGIRFFGGERVDLSEFVVLQRSTYPVLTTLHQAVHRSLASLLEPNPKGGGKLLLLRVYCCILRVSVVISVVAHTNLCRSLFPDCSVKLVIYYVVYILFPLACMV